MITSKILDQKEQKAASTTPTTVAQSVLTKLFPFCSGLVFSILSVYLVY